MVTVNIEKRHLFIILAFVVFLAGVIIVVAYGGSQPSVMGHSSSEIDFAEHIWGACTWRAVGYQKSHDPAAGNWCNDGEYIVQMDITSGNPGSDYPIISSVRCCKL